jgi:hypothetical protein
VALPYVGAAAPVLPIVVVADVAGNTSIRLTFWPQMGPRWSGAQRPKRSVSRACGSFLIFSALLLSESNEGLLVLGIHAGTPYFDCSPAFIDRINPLVQECTGGRVSVLAPFVRWTKDDVYSFFISSGIPLGETYSGQGRTYPAPSSRSRTHPRPLRSWWTASSIRPDLICDRDSIPIIVGSSG